MPDLTDLIARVEVATADSAARDELGVAVNEALGIASYITDDGDPTQSLDAAMTLVPDGWWLAGFYFCHPDFRSQQDRAWCAEFAGPVTWAVVDREVGEEPQFDHVSATAATPALALCAAALKARNHQKGQP